MEKYTNFTNLVQYVKSYTVIISGTQLQKNVHNSQCMLPGCSAPLWMDWVERGSGVIISIQDCYTITALSLPETATEIVWG